MISVNEKCVGCGACVRDCPMGILQLKDGRPSVREEKAAGCIVCRHCLAVCPTDAIALRGVKASEGLSLEGLSLPTAEMAANLLVSRRSIRQYAAEEIPPARIRGLLETMKSVPTGCNIRHLAFRYVETRARMDELRRRMVELLLAKEATLPDFLQGVVAAIRKKPEIDPFFRGAPHLLIVQGDPSAVTPQVDCDAACAYFDLLMQGSGYGTTWCGFLKIIVDAAPEVADVFGIPRGAPFYAMLFGVPAVRYVRTPPRADGAQIARV